MLYNVNMLFNARRTVLKHECNITTQSIGFYLVYQTTSLRCGFYLGHSLNQYKNTKLALLHLKLEQLTILYLLKVRSSQDTQNYLLTIAIIEI